MSNTRSVWEEKNLFLLCQIKFYKRAYKYRYVKSVIILKQLLQDYDDKLFTKVETNR